MNWWCSAQNQRWDWTWTPYLGVWLIAGLLIIAYVSGRVWGKRRGLYCSGRQLASYVGGVAVFWIAADWPLAAIGASYLLSVHTLQYVLFVFAVPPLMIWGMPPWMLRRLLASKPLASLARMFSRPLVALVTFNGILLVSHVPRVVDGLTVTQAGSFAVNMAWLFSGFVFWWQILAPLPEWKPMHYGGRLLFLLANLLVTTIPASFLIFSEYPIYSLYELAPPFGGLSTIQDQRIAAMIMKILGGLIIVGIGAVLFFRWNRKDGVEGDLVDSAGGKPVRT